MSPRRWSIEDPEEKSMHEFATIEGHIAECRDGNYLAFVFLKDLDKMKLYKEHNVHPGDFEFWARRYKKMSEKMN